MDHPKISVDDNLTFIIRVMLWTIPRFLLMKISLYNTCYVVDHPKISVDENTHFYNTCYVVDHPKISVDENLTFIIRVMLWTIPRFLLMKISLL